MARDSATEGFYRSNCSKSVSFCLLSEAPLCKGSWRGLPRLRDCLIEKLSIMRQRTTILLTFYNPSVSLTADSSLCTKEPQKEATAARLPRLNLKKPSVTAQKRRATFLESKKAHKEANALRLPQLNLKKPSVSLRLPPSRLRYPACGSRNIITKHSLAQYFDRCAEISSLHPPQAALGYFAVPPRL